VPNCGRVTLNDGEMIVSYSCGGGGYGPPLERDPEIVGRDVREGFVSVERARDVYGVVIDDAGNVVYPDTEALRAAAH
ncbi:MAG: hydantoinase B/oxoprolinase family protein, partial [Alphaproteobacteria bacterium]|nr:hydantoinase B/oxoprolinase family protein [Alphaproteobacteria bacterium]